MYLAVLTFQYVNNPTGIPPAWPAEIRGLGNSQTLPPGVGWQLMTQAQFDAYITTNQNDFLKWQALKNPGTELHYIQVYTGSLLTSEAWYSGKDNSGNYTGQVRGIVYTYSGPKVMTYVESLYDQNGTPTVIKIITYKTDSSGNVKKIIQEGS